MHNFGPEKYVPIVLMKRGERAGLSGLAAGIRVNVVPLWVVHEPDLDWDTGLPKKTLQDHLASLPKELAACWKGPAFLDMNEAGDDFLGAEHALAWFHASALAEGLELTPVVSPNSSQDYLDAVESIVAAGGDACLRLFVDDWPAGGGSGSLDDLLQSIGASASECHLVLDMRDDVGAAAARLLVSELRTLPYLQDWKSLTAASTAIPDSMPPGSGLHVLPRHDWRIYVGVRGLGLPRDPSFGDYAINGVSLGVDINPAVMQISATLRYTTEDDWLVAKGGLFKAHGGKSMGARAVPPAADLLVKHPDFSGAGHCSFEDWLLPVAGGTGGSNPEAWRREGTTHHVTRVVPQVASLGASATGP